MAQQEHLDRLLASVAENNGCQTWNTWHRSFYDGFMYTNNVDLRDADLSFLNMERVNFGDARLSHATCLGANLHRANLRRAILSRANFEKADLSYANLDRTVLSGANLRHANLTAANVLQTRLDATLLDGTDCTSAAFTAVDLTCDLHTCTLTNARIDSIRGAPIWPPVAAETLERLRAEACDLTTTSERLLELAFEWPGYLMQERIAANPNAAPLLLLNLAHQHPAAFLQNPALPLLFLEHPQWIDAGSAGDILAALEALPNYPELAQHYADILQWLRHAAI